MVVISSVRGGRPEAGCSDLGIRHLAPAASREDVVAGENRADGGDGGVPRRYLDEGIVM